MHDGVDMEDSTSIERQQNLESTAHVVRPPLENKVTLHRCSQTLNYGTVASFSLSSTVSHTTEEHAHQQEPQN